MSTESRPVEADPSPPGHRAAHRRGASRCRRCLAARRRVRAAVDRRRAASDAPAPGNPAAIEQAQQKAAVTGLHAAVPRRPSVEDARGPRRGDRPGLDRRRGSRRSSTSCSPWSRPQNQRAFLGALGAFDMAAINKHGKAWIAHHGRGAGRAAARGLDGGRQESPMRGHFQNLKDWIAGAYYSSETGMRELGWNGNVIHQRAARVHPSRRPSGLIAVSETPSCRRRDSM